MTPWELRKRAESARLLSEFIPPSWRVDFEDAARRGHCGCVVVVPDGGHDELLGKLVSEGFGVFNAWDSQACNLSRWLVWWGSKPPTGHHGEWKGPAT
jgi:hypothetical protein